MGSADCLGTDLARTLANSTIFGKSRTTVRALAGLFEDQMRMNVKHLA